MWCSEVPVLLPTSVPVDPANALDEPLLPQAESSATPPSGILRSFVERGRTGTGSGSTPNDDTHTTNNNNNGTQPTAVITRRVSFGAEPTQVERRMVQLLREDDETENEGAELPVLRSTPSIYQTSQLRLLRFIMATLLGGITGIATSAFIVILCHGIDSVEIKLYLLLQWPRWLYNGARAVVGGALTGAILLRLDARDTALPSQRSTGIHGWGWGITSRSNRLMDSVIVIPVCTSNNELLAWLSASRSFAMLVSSVIALVIIRAPLGPEFGLVILARSLAIIANHIDSLFQSDNGRQLDDEDTMQTGSCTLTRIQMWCDVAFASVVGGIGLPIQTAIILGPVMMLELGHRRTREQRRMETPFQSTIPTPESSDDDQDTNQVLLLQTIAILAASSSSQFVTHALGLDHSWGLQRMDLFRSDDVANMFGPRELLMAAVVGCLCGTVGALVQAMIFLIEESLQSLRTLTARWTNSRAFTATAAFGPAICAGLLICLTAVALPTVNDGFFPGRPSEPWSSDQIHTTTTTTVSFTTRPLTDVSEAKWVWLAVVKSAEISVALGVGLLGGSILPMANIGWYIGNALVGITSWLPAHVTVSCAIASSAVTVAHTPMTLLLASILVFGLPLQSSGNVLVAMVVSLTLFTALVSPFQQSAKSSEATSQQSDQDERPLINPDNEFLNNVRTTIFGGA